MTISREQIEQKLRTSNAWVERAILRLYRLQTRREQNQNVTEEQNGVGFNKIDARTGGYLARWIMSGKPLTGRWVTTARAMSLRYSQQLADIANSSTAEPNAITSSETTTETTNA